MRTISSNFVLRRLQNGASEAGQDVSKIFRILAPPRRATAEAKIEKFTNYFRFEEADTSCAEINCGSEHVLRCICSNAAQSQPKGVQALKLQAFSSTSATAAPSRRRHVFARAAPPDRGGQPLRRPHRHRMAARRDVLPRDGGRLRPVHASTQDAVRPRRLDRGGLSEAAREEGEHAPAAVEAACFTGVSAGGHEDSPTGASGWRAGVRRATR